MFGPLRRCSIVFIASVCSGFWMYVLETVRNFSKISTRTSSLLYVSAIAFFVSRRTVIWKLLRTNIRWPPTSHFSTNGIARISAYWNGMPRLQIKCHPCRLIFPFPPPPPPLYFFSLFSNSRANEPVRKLSNYLFSLYTYLYFIAI